MPRLGAEHIAIGAGSTQLTHDLFRTLLDPGDTVLLMDPTYANYEGQLAFAAPDIQHRPAAVVDPRRWTYLPDTAPDRVIADFQRVFDAHQPRLVMFGAPDNPTSQILPQTLADAMLQRTRDAGAWLAIDFAYKCQYFETPPAYYAWSPADHPHVIGIHSNSKWGRGLGRRLGWLDSGARRGRRDRTRAAVQPALPGHAVADGDDAVLSRAIEDGSLRAYVAADQRAVSRGRARHDRGRRRTSAAAAPRARWAASTRVVDVGTDADAFVPRALKATGVLVVPGGGFGPSLAHGVRISYGPLVMNTEKIREGLARLGRWMAGDPCRLRSTANSPR